MMMRERKGRVTRENCHVVYENDRNHMVLMFLHVYNAMLYDRNHVALMSLHVYNAMSYMKMTGTMWC